MTTTSGTMTISQSGLSTVAGDAHAVQTFIQNKEVSKQVSNQYLMSQTQAKPYFILSPALFGRPVSRRFNKINKFSAGLKAAKAHVFFGTTKSLVCYVSL